MVRALGIGFALLLFYVALHTLSVQWLIAIVILSGALTVVVMPKTDRNPMRWLPPDEDIAHVHYGDEWNDERKPWTLDDELAMRADLDYDEERSE